MGGSAEAIFLLAPLLPMRSATSNLMTPNQALQRTAPGRQAWCSRLNPPRTSHCSPIDRPPLVPYTASSAVPPQSLSFESLGDSARLP